MNFEIDKGASKPIYKQLIDNVRDNIEKKTLKFGSKLPAERELSEKLDISRGTVKKAYEELEKEGCIKVIWGSGAFIIKKNEDNQEISEKEYILSFITHMEDKGYSKREIENFLSIAMLKKFSSKKVTVAAVDCNFEALQIFKKQLSSMKELNCMCFLLEDVSKFSYPHQIFENFDIIFTTTSHYEDLIKIIPGHEDKIMKAVVSPDRETIVKLLQIPDKIGIFVKSRRFRDIVNSNLSGQGQRIPERDCLFEKWADTESFERFIKEKEAIIMPPLYAMDLPFEIYERIIEFARVGGKIITFNYMIEKGSIIHIEDRISNILYNFKEW